MKSNPPAHKQQLLARLDAIAQAAAKTGQSLALLGLGSVGLEQDRLDVYSDLDFFLIVQPGAKQTFLKDLGWLSAPAPLAYSFRNTVDGYKALYADGIFCEFAVFEPNELAEIPFAPGRVVWHADGFDPAQLQPTPRPPSGQSLDRDWLLGEALTNLYVGLGRYRRGEKLSGMRFIQNYAVERVLELAALERSDQAPPDRFDVARRAEQRFPALASELPAFMQGYANSLASARAILAYLDAHYAVNPAMRAAIVALCED